MFKEVVLYPPEHSDGNRWRWRVVKTNGNEVISSLSFDTREEAEAELNASKYASLPSTLLSASLGTEEGLD